MLSARPNSQRIVGLATASVGTICLLLFFIKWRRSRRRQIENRNRSGTSTVSVQCELDPQLSSISRAITDALNLDTRDPDVLNSIDVFVDAGRTLLESWRNRLSPMPQRFRQRLGHQNARALATGDAASNQDSAVDLYNDFDVTGASNRRFDDFDIQSNVSSEASFLSAVEELEEMDRALQEHFAASLDDAMELANRRMRENKEELIPCRTLRTKQFGCASDEEFLAKLHLIRCGYHNYLSDPLKQDECSRLGKLIFSKIISEFHGDVDGFEKAYDELLLYCSKPENIDQVKEELMTRGVPHFGFYDVVLDFILMDALDELDETPQSVHTALASTWLPESLKKNALSAAISTAIRAKRARMKFGDGFMSRYYALSDFLSLPLAWAILGPSSPLQDKLTNFQKLVAQYVRECFSSEFVNFNSEAAISRTLGNLTDKYIEQLCFIFGVEKS